MKKVKGFFKSIFDDKKKLGIIAAVVIAVVYLIYGCSVTLKQRKAEEQAALEAEEAERLAEEQAAMASESENDAYLITVQDSLIESYGKLPDGYIWDFDGTLLSLGDPSMTAEEVVYAYLNGIRTLDFSVAQRYSRRSTVVNIYNDYFDSSAGNTDYYDSFFRNMYKEVLLSMQINGIKDNTIFADNKQVFTVSISLLDLTNKDFWQEDKYNIYKELYIYSADEADSTKGEMFLYDYVLDYYRSGNAKSRDTLVNITVEKYPDLNTGWLVSIDTDVSDVCSYKDGNLMASYIMSMYNEEGREIILEEREKQEEAKKQAQEANTEDSQE